MAVTAIPRDFNRSPIEAEVTPLPRPDKTPPEIITNFNLKFNIPRKLLKRSRGKFGCSRRESNPHQLFRRQLLYPLSYASYKRKLLKLYQKRRNLTFFNLRVTNLKGY